ncbi:phosphatidate cytidylyltransferase [Vitreoscilla massiliensis]|uniref:Phosphatidate cytidylyltransferase n=1 Tax=Vitreoscilla massiliensis TaxID=1689272 RepID=A0ABY4DX31_9NEIS|nr:phosphatidate cytidylyltransferase [Vitreoscilla massiliensis]UOO88081.1 phosphatidate cytidylyltransferase [Vitreoscilla massiliensis]
MTLPFSLWWLFLAILAILITASSVGSILALKYGSQNPTISNLNARINAWWVMTLVLVLAFITGHIGSTFLFFLVSFAALRECLSLIYSRRGDYAVLVACFYVVLPVQYYFVLTDWYGMFAIFIPVYAFLLLPILAGLSGDPTRFLDRTAKIQWSLMVSVFCISHVPFLLNLKIENFDQNILLVIFLIAVVQASDVLQYIWGKLLGKRKIAPVLSPSKTVEGFVGGVASATALATALWWITPFTPFQAGLIGLIICLMGFAGGLVMSAVKRDFGVKDWGHMIKGHGGMMDRVDSICFAAPIFFHIVRYYWS